MLVADTGAMFALLDAGDRHHQSVKALYLENRDGWLLPWAILPEVDDLAATRLGPAAHRAWVDDLVAGAYTVEWGRDSDLAHAQALAAKYGSLEMGLVDAVVMALAERLRADIATLDLRHFGAVTLKHSPRLLPRDLQPRARVRR